MISKKNSEQHQKRIHYPSHNNYDHIRSSYSSSWYFQLQNTSNNPMTMSKSSKTIFNSISFNSCIILFLFFIIVFIISLFILFPSLKQDQTFRHHRLKRQIFATSSFSNNKQHNVDVLRRLFNHRNTSGVPTDCSINMGSDGIYRPPSKDSIAFEIISLVENYFKAECKSLRRMAEKLRTQLYKTTTYVGDFGLSEFRNDHGHQLRILLAVQPLIKEIQIKLASPVLNDNNGGAYVYYNMIKYSRLNNHSTSTSSIDYESIQEESMKHSVNIILQLFTASNARETVQQSLKNNNSTMLHNWWLGPILCEKNKNETFIMAHVFPLTER